MNVRINTVEDNNIYDEWLRLKKEGVISNRHPFKWYKDFYQRWNKITKELPALLDKQKRPVIDIFNIG